MAKTKTTANVPTKASAKSAPASPPPVQSHAIRETVESIVIAFVLAFLFRTFEAEAFVIPTGSMAPTLMGRHKDVVCPKCGYRYQVSASEEENEDPGGRTSDCIAGKCPMCQYVLPMRPDLPEGVPERELAEKHWREDHPGVDHAPTAKDLAAYIPWLRSYNGDRILVNKYIYSFSDPKRWDVVVFKFPGDAKINYIKRLVGLPGEKLRIFQGDIFLGKEDSNQDREYEIIRKPPNKIRSMRQLVHDTNYDPAELDALGWPLRWNSSVDNGASAWITEKKTSGENVRQEYSVDAAEGADSWLRYENFVPTYRVWQDIADAPKGDGKQPMFSDANRAQWRRLITDSNPYDGRVDRNHMAFPTLQIAPEKEGLHWVGDLMLEADVNIESGKGEMLLDLVKGGRHFTCRVDLATGEAKFLIAGMADFAPKAKTSLKGPSKHRVAFSNFDDQMLLWVDGGLVSFDGATTYDADKVFGNRDRIRPETSDKDLGDFAPAGIGARGAKLSVSRLQVWRDIYYIAEDYKRMKSVGGPVTDFNPPFDNQLFDLPLKPSLWNRFSQRNKADFVLNEDQLFVMGDNSAESSDARLWESSPRGKPGGPYLDRRLLIGKALCVYWPHSWNRIPGTPIPFPLFPNIADMRLVR
jgi:signal peptidase I